MANTYWWLGPVGPLVDYTIDYISDDSGDPTANLPEDEDAWTVDDVREFVAAWQDAPRAALVESIREAGRIAGQPADLIETAIAEAGDSREALLGLLESIVGEAGQTRTDVLQYLRETVPWVIGGTLATSVIVAAALAATAVGVVSVMYGGGPAIAASLASAVKR